MAVSQLEPSAALLIVDMQKGIKVFPNAPMSTDEIAGRIGELANAFRARSLPVVLINVAGAAPGRTERSHSFNPPADWAELLPQLGAQPGDHRITKERWGAFQHTDLDAVLKDKGVTQVVLVGFATSIGVESTARAAYDHGYHVVLVPDAMTDLDANNHKHSVEQIFPILGETGSIADVLALLS